MILGSGPNRIGQGIEFDYCCVQAALALREDGFETIMVNSNPETVSTDFDISDRLYFEPLTLEDVLEIVAREQPEGVIVQLGGQTPLKLAEPLEELGVPIFGTSVDAIDRAEDRDRFAELCRAIGAAVPAQRHRHQRGEAVAGGAAGGLPGLVRPSYVLGGRAMEIVYDEARSGPISSGRSGPARTTPSSSTASWRTPSRRTWTRSPTVRTPSSPASCSTSRTRASTRATRRASCLPTSSRTRRWTRCGAGPPLRHRAGRRGPHQRAVRRPGWRGLRAGGEPPRVADRPVRGQGHGHPVRPAASRVMAGKTAGRGGPGSRRTRCPWPWP
jgi:hypothetical protein